MFFKFNSDSPSAYLHFSEDDGLVGRCPDGVRHVGAHHMEPHGALVMLHAGG